MSKKILDEPPYESPIERALGMILLPAPGEHCQPIVQKEMRAGGHNYRVDFFIGTPRRNVVIETDGRDFHNVREDRHRDIRIIKSGNADEILRFKGPDIHYEVGQCFRFIVSVFPFLFDPKAEPLDSEAHGLIRASMNAMQIQPILRVRVGSSIGELKAQNWDWSHRRIYRNEISEGDINGLR